MDTNPTSLGRLLQFLASACTFLSGLCLVVLVVSFGWLVFGRYVLNDTPTWIEQLSMLLIITITFLSSAAGVQERTHLSVDILPMMCRARTQSVLKIFSALVLAGFGAVMAYYAQGLMSFTWYKIIPLLNLPEGVRYIPVMISGALIVIFSLGRVFSELTEFFPARNNKQNAKNSRGVV